MKRILIALSLLLVLCACEKHPVERMTIADVALAPPPKVDQVKFPPPIVAADKEDLPADNKVTKKIIKQGDISFETSDTKRTREEIYAELKRIGGYVSNEEENNDSELCKREYTLTTEIPAKNFDSFLNNVSANAGKIDSKNISISDVTTQYIDVTTRLANKKKLEERYLELLKKGDKMADVLEIESKLNDIRTEIESTQGQLNYLNKQIDYSTLEIKFYTKQPANYSGDSLGIKISRALLHGWLSLGEFFFALISVWPLWLVLGVLFGVLKRWLKNRRAKKNA